MKLASSCISIAPTDITTTHSPKIRARGADFFPKVKTPKDSNRVEDEVQSSTPSSTFSNILQREVVQVIPELFILLPNN